MRPLAIRAVRVAIALLVLMPWACKKDGPTGPAPAVSIQLSQSAISVPQGQSAAVGITLARENGFAAPVTLTIEGLPTGVTGSFDPVLVPGTQGSTLTVVASAAAPAGAHTLTVRARGQGVDDETATLTVTISAVPAGYTLTSSPAGLVAPTGTSSSIQLAVARSSTFAGGVTLSVEGLPSGVTATFAANPTTSGISTLTLDVSPGTPAQTYHLTIRGSAAGLEDRTIPFDVQVLPRAAGNVTFGFCDSPAPIWVAFQDAGGQWARVLAGPNGTYTFPISGHGGVAAVTREGSGYALDVIYGTTAELNTLGTQSELFDCDPIGGPKQLIGILGGVASSEYADITLGPRAATVASNKTAYTLADVPNGPLDLLAARGVDTFDEFAANKIIIRRGLDLPSGSTIPMLDFNSTEAVALVPAVLTIGNLSAVEDMFFQSDYRTVGNAAVLLSGSFGGGTLQSYPGVPSTQQVAGDLHEIFALSIPSDPNGTTARVLVTAFHTAGDRTLTFGPTIGTPTVTSLGNTPYARYRMQLAVQSEYAGMATAFFRQVTRSASILATSGYFGGVPATWDLAVPDLTGASGFDPLWGLRPGVSTNWSVEAASTLLFLELVDGETIRFADRGGTTGPALMGSLRDITARPALHVLPSVRGSSLLSRARGGRMR